MAYLCNLRNRSDYTSFVKPGSLSIQFYLTGGVVFNTPH